MPVARRRSPGSFLYTDSKPIIGGFPLCRCNICAGSRGGDGATRPGMVDRPLLVGVRFRCLTARRGGNECRAISRRLGMPAPCRLHVRRHRRLWTPRQSAVSQRRRACRQHHGTRRCRRNRDGRCMVVRRRRRRPASRTLTRMCHTGLIRAMRRDSRYPMRRSSWVANLVFALLLFAGFLVGRRGVASGRSPSSLRAVQSRWWPAWFGPSPSAPAGSWTPWRCGSLGASS